MMPGVCPNSWQPYECEWAIGYLWRWTNLLERLALFGLALMLVHIVVVAIRVSHRCHSARRAKGMDRANQAFRRDRRKLVNKLNLWVGSLKSIASTAPYLGLAGTCLGTLSIFQGYVGSRNGFFVMVVTQVDAAFLSTAAGLLVAVPAVVSYNYLRSLIDSLDREVLGNVHELTGQSFQVAQRLPLAARFSKIPFAAVAAPLLAFSIMAYATFASFHAPTGLHVALPSARCEYSGDDRTITLHITDAGKLFLNTEQEDRNSLATRLSQIYSFRVHRTLYLFADDGVAFQNVADAIDIVENTPVTAGAQSDRVTTDELNITVQLVTPGAMNAGCHDFVVAGSSQHTSR